MPDREKEVTFEQLHRDSGRRFDGKQVVLQAVPSASAEEVPEIEGVEMTEKKLLRLADPARPGVSIAAVVPEEVELKDDSGAMLFRGKLYTEGLGDHPHVLIVESAVPAGAGGGSRKAAEADSCPFAQSTFSGRSVRGSSRTLTDMERRI